MQLVNKTVNLKLVGLDGNAFSIMGAFQSQAKKEKWTKEEITKVLDEAMSGDYNHLLATITDHCSNVLGNDDDDDDDDNYYDEDTIYCPKCDSSNVREFFDPDDSIKGESSFECLDCDNIFKDF